MRISVSQASQLLRSGQVAAVPTETVYGLAASLHNLNAVDAIFTLKGRPSNNPLIIHVSHPEQINAFVSDFPPDFDRLVEAFWPGPFTVVLPVDSAKIPSKVRAGLPTAAFRIPNHSLALELLHQTGPLVMPSANLSGKPSATKPEHVEADFGMNFPILDGGPCQRGLESTIAIFHNERWEIIRLGSLAPSDFARVLGYAPAIGTSSKETPFCPGQLHRHYAPKAVLVLHIPSTPTGVILGFREKTYPKSCRVIFLGSLHNPETVAENLYAILRQLDQENIGSAYVDLDFPRTGLWATIHERFIKAANK